MTLRKRAQELREDRRHGGSWLARRAVEALVDVGGEEAGSSEELLERLLEAARALAESRPGFGAIEGALGRVLGAVRREAHLPVDELRRVLEDEARALLDSRRRAAASIAIQLQDRLTDAFVLTHSASATVREALAYTPPELVVCTVSAPHEEGRAFAEELAAAGIRAQVVEDAEADEELSRASLLLIGADTVYADGTLCNKTGTLALAEKAQAQNVPAVVACEVIKLAPFGAEDAPSLPGEVRSLLDFVPPELIDEIVTEEGTFHPAEIGTLADRTPFLREGYEILRAGPAGSRP
jgi:ribose 1,5-bisphosphate isomerase